MSLLNLIVRDHDTQVATVAELDRQFRCETARNVDQVGSRAQSARGRTSTEGQSAACGRVATPDVPASPLAAAGPGENTATQYGTLPSVYSLLYR